MFKSTLVLLLLLTTLIGCKKNDLTQLQIDAVAQTAAPTLLIDKEYLAEAKLRLEKNDPTLKPAFDRLIKQADKALSQGPFSVTDKERIPPSGDKHDYASYSRYWWPDPDQPDGLPYIRKDGETNPASQNPESSDRRRIGALGKNTETLGLAYYLTGEEKYATKAAQLLRVWFLDEATRMNPNLNHAQCRPGHNTGSKSGVLDGRLMVKALEGSLLIYNSNAISTAERQGLQEWAKKYLEWLTTCDLALQEAAAKNNHGSFYDAQAIYFALYSENYNDAKELATNFTVNRLTEQILPDGSMPHEMARTRPHFYSMYNLHAMFLVATLSEHVGIDAWQAEDSRLFKALDFLVPYTDTNNPWPQPTLGETDRMAMFPILLMADRVYPNGDYLRMLEVLPIEERKEHRSNLLLMGMR